MAELDLNVNVNTKGSQKLRQVGANIGKVALGATAAIAGIAAFTSGFASDLNESLSKVGVVFGKSAKDIEAWSKKANTELGLSQQAALEAAGTFGNLFDSMGFGEKPTEDMSKGLVELAADLASFNNISIDEALVKLRAGIVGEAEPLRTLGVNISAAATKAKALELGLIGVGDEMTAADKAAANYAIIMEQTTNAQGDFARTSDGMANQQRILAATFDDTMAQIGQAFIPLIQDLLPVLTAGLVGFGNWITDNMPTIQTVVGTVLGVIGEAFRILTEDILPTVIPIIAGLVGVITSAFGNVGGAVGGLQNLFAGLAAWIHQNLPTIMSVASQVFGAIANVIKSVMPVVIEVAKVLFPALGTAASVLFKVLDVAFKGIGGAFEALGNVFETVADVITGVVSGVVGAFKAIYNAFAGFWNSIDITFPTIDVPFFGRIGGFSIGLPDIPLLASGGIVTKPTLAIIGESGPEAVIPLGSSQTPGTVNNFTFHVQSPIPDEKGIVSLVGRSQRLQAMLP